MDPPGSNLSDTGGDALDRFRFPSSLEARYRPRRCLGAGGMGAVFEAWDGDLERVVAVKVTMPFGSRAYFERFRREAEALARLDHPNIVRIFAHGESDLCPYIVMEHLEGSSLAGSVGTLENLEPMLQVAAGLEAIHAAGLVHRDVKPGNIVVTSSGRAVLVDFGVAFDPERSRLTRVGGAVGTPGFVAPEVLEGKEAGPRADWFAWGVTLFLLVEGRAPFTAQEVMTSVGGHELPALEFRRTRPEGAPAELIRRCLERNPGLRLAGLDEVKQVLKLPGSTFPRRRDGEVPAALAVQRVGGPGRREGRAPTYPGIDPPSTGTLRRLLRMLGLLVLLALAAAWLRPELVMHVLGGRVLPERPSAAPSPSSIVTPGG